MIIKGLNAGFYEERCYIVADEESMEGAIIDPGGQGEKILKVIEEIGFRPKYILLTHGHLDHVGAVEFLSKHLNIAFYISEKEEKFMMNDKTDMGGTPLFGTLRKADGYLTEESKLSLGNKEIQVVETPGHTVGGLCLIIDGNIFSGDTLFNGSVGRSDFPGGDMGLLVSMIKTKLFKLNDSMEVYPGHGPKTTIGFEKVANPYLR